MAGRPKFYPKETQAMKVYAMRLPESVANYYRKLAAESKRSLRDTLRVALENHMECPRREEKSI